MKNECNKTKYFASNACEMLDDISFITHHEFILNLYSVFWRTGGFSDQNKIGWKTFLRRSIAELHTYIGGQWSLAFGEALSYIGPSFIYIYLFSYSDICSYALL